MTKTIHNEENFVEHYPDPTAGTAIRNIEHEKNSRRGYRSRAIGKNFEKMIEAACRQYRNIGVAIIEKTPEPMKVIKGHSQGRFTACFEKKAQPDFKGCTQYGKAVIFEAKATEQDRIKKNAVTGKQFESLDSYWKVGAEVFVLVSFCHERYYRVPWGVWREMETFYGRKYLKEEDIKDCQVCFKNGYIDFLERELWIRSGDEK
ncbi:MAG: recombination protein [Eubacteriaceae bacterium]|jgi:recombination protein U|nr:recombination protein [Eubacteriaceae bacterium]